MRAADEGKLRRIVKDAWTMEERRIRLDAHHFLLELSRGRAPAPSDAPAAALTNVGS